MERTHNWLVPVVLGVGGIYLFKQSGAAVDLQRWFQEQSERDGGWTTVTVIYAAVVLSTFLLGYAKPEMRPALISWYVL